MPVLYCSSTLSLACFEVLVHVETDEIPEDYVWSRAEIASPDLLDFHGDLQDESSTRARGSEWLRNRQLAVRVSSVIIPHEHNVLLNGSADGYEKILWEDPVPFAWDPRLFD